MHTMALVALVLSIAFGYDIAQHPVYNFVHVPKCGGSEIKYLLRFWARHVKGDFQGVCDLGPGDSVTDGVAHI